MVEQVPASGLVHWVGTGLSTGRGLKLLADSGSKVVLWGRTEAKASACADRLGLGGRVATRVLDDDALAEEVRAGDVVVSMLPGVHHAALLRLSLDKRAHFADTSYVSPEIAELAASAVDRGTVVLTEAGLDPGIDHLLAHDLLARATEQLGDGAATAWFTSYCGGVPAVPNEFRYRFSWAPQGVLTALRSPARYVEGGTELVAQRPWEATRAHRLRGESFEAYPNRDSTPFVGQYRVPASWHLDTFVRGTLRLDGWRDAWAEVFAELLSGDEARIRGLALRLAGEYPMTAADRDRVVLAVSLAVQPPQGPLWTAERVLDLTGTEHETAMARCVSVTLATGIAEIMAGRTAPGLHRPVEDGETARRWLESLRAQGIAAESLEQVPSSKA